MSSTTTTPDLKPSPTRPDPLTAAATAQGRRPGLALSTIETCHCTRCESQIPRHHILKRIAQTPLGVISPTSRTLWAWCEFCDVFYQVQSVLIDGWRQAGDVQIVTDPQMVACIRSEIEQRDGTRRAAAGA
jgi:hypothetical protein